MAYRLVSCSWPVLHDQLVVSGPVRLPVKGHPSGNASSPPGSPSSSPDCPGGRSSPGSYPGLGRRASCGRRPGLRGSPAVSPSLAPMPWDSPSLASGCRNSAVRLLLSSGLLPVPLWQLCIPQRELQSAGGFLCRGRTVGRMASRFAPGLTAGVASTHALHPECPEQVKSRRRQQPGRSHQPDTWPLSEPEAASLRSFKHWEPRI